LKFNTGFTPALIPGEKSKRYNKMRMPLFFSDHELSLSMKQHLSTIYRTPKKKTIKK
jgi:hypothetical protein